MSLFDIINSHFSVDMYTLKDTHDTEAFGVERIRQGIVMCWGLGKVEGEINWVYSIIF